MIITRSPFRITLGGGGTDLPSFYKKHGGIVFSMAIDKYIYLNFKQSAIDTAIRLQCYKPEVVQKIEDLKHSRAREALKRYDISHSVEINSIADLPASSGLGSSGSYLVALLHTLRYYKNQNLHPGAVAEEACDIEINVLQEPVGKQDQYIASYGGIRILDINKSGKVSVKDINLNYSDILTFLNNTHIYYTGKLRSASEILKEQNNLSYNVEDKLLKIKDLSYEFIDSFVNCDFDNFGLLLDKHWNLKKKLSDKISFSEVDEIYKLVKDDFGVLGGKIIGAGGGGFLMLYVPTGGKKLENFMINNNMPRMHYNVDPHGCNTVADLRSYNSILNENRIIKSCSLWSVK